MTRRKLFSSISISFDPKPCNLSLSMSNPKILLQIENIRKLLNERIFKKKKGIGGKKFNFEQTLVNDGVK